MKTERRHELERNELAAWLGRVTESLAPLRKYWGAVLVAVAVVLVGSWLLGRRAGSSEKQAWFNLMAAGSPEDFEIVASRWPDSTAGAWAKLRWTDGELLQGLEALLRDRERALVHLRAAQRSYAELTAQDFGLSFLNQRAAMGLAAAHEGLGEIEEAIKAYEDLARRYPDSPLAKEALERAAELKTGEAGEFYAWLESHKPASTAAAGGAGQGDAGAAGQDDAVPQPEFEAESEAAAGKEEQPTGKPAAEPARDESPAEASSADPSKPAGDAPPASDAPGVEKPAEDSRPQSTPEASSDER